MPLCSFSILLALTCGYMHKPLKLKERFTSNLFIYLNFTYFKVRYLSKSQKICPTDHILLMSAHTEKIKFNIHFLD